MTTQLNPVLRYGASISLVALIVLCLLWEFKVAPLRPGGSLLALKVLPLLLPSAWRIEGSTVHLAMGGHAYFALLYGRGGAGVV